MANPKAKKGWIQNALKNHKKGSLHRMLKIPVNQKIPLTRLHKAINDARRLSKTAKTSARRKWYKLLGQRARLTLTLNKINARRRG